MIHLSAKRVRVGLPFGLFRPIGHGRPLEDLFSGVEQLVVVDLGKVCYAFVEHKATDDNITNVSRHSKAVFKSRLRTDRMISKYLR